MRALLGLVACLAAFPVWANEPWRVMRETPAEVVAIDLSSLERSAGQVRFRERRVVRDGRIHPNSLRPVREVLSRGVVDCRARRIATLSRAVFSDEDALIDHQATRLQQAVWQLLPREDSLFRQLCGRS